MGAPGFSPGTDPSRQHRKNVTPEGILRHVRTFAIAQFEGHYRPVSLARNFAPGSLADGGDLCGYSQAGVSVGPTINAVS